MTPIRIMGCWGDDMAARGRRSRQGGGKLRRGTGPFSWPDEHPADAEASATQDPDTPAKIMLATTFTRKVPGHVPDDSPGRR